MKKDIELHWEWPDDRTPTQTVRVAVESMRKTPKGLFGFKKSPSYAFSYPDSMDLQGVVVGGDQHTDKKTLILTLPLEFVGGVKAGDTVELSLIDSSTCIGVSAQGK